MSSGMTNHKCYDWVPQFSVIPDPRLPFRIPKTCYCLVFALSGRCWPHGIGLQLFHALNNIVKNQIMLKKVILFLFLLIKMGSVAHVSAQDYDRRISLSTWIEEMKSNKDSVYHLSNTEIYYDEKADTLYAWWRPRTPEEDTIPREEIHIHSTVQLINCKLPEQSTVVLGNLTIHGNFSLTSCKGASQVIFYNCTFHDGFDVRNSDLGAFQFLTVTFFRESLFQNYKSTFCPSAIARFQPKLLYQTLRSITDSNKRINLINICLSSGRMKKRSTGLV